MIPLFKMLEDNQGRSTVDQLWQAAQENEQEQARQARFQARQQVKQNAVAKANAEFAAMKEQERKDRIAAKLILREFARESLSLQHKGLVKIA